MIKKGYHIIVALMLLLGTTGVTISQHYCHGKLVSSSIFGKAQACCEFDCPACQDKTITQRINDDFVFSVFIPEHAKLIQLFNVQSPLLAIHTTNGIQFSPYKISYQKAPPLLINSETPEFLEVFRC